MGFSFDFTGERNVIVYQAEAGMVLDENIYRLLRSELMGTKRSCDRTSETAGRKDKIQW